MRRQASVADVAAIAGVSIRTVSNVVNGYAHVSISTRRKVEEAIRKTGYRPNITAKRLRQGRTGTIGLAVPNLGWPYFGEIAHLVQIEAQKRDYSVLVAETQGSLTREMAVLENFASGIVDGFIFSPQVARPADLASLDLRIPVALIGERIRDAGFLHVAVDNERAAMAVADHLIEAGARSFAVLGTLDPLTGAGPGPERMSGFARALESAGLPSSAWVGLEVSPWTYEGSYHSMLAFLQEHPTPDAVFAMNDILASAAIRALRDVGADVPQDVLVAGWDDVDISRYFLPSLTTIRPDKEGLVAATISGVIDRIEGESGGETEVEIPFELIVRESTSPGVIPPGHPRRSGRSA